MAAADRSSSWRGGGLAGRMVYWVGGSSMEEERTEEGQEHLEGDNFVVGWDKADC